MTRWICADNLPYKKVGKNEPVCIADEVPIDIPETWEWARLKDLAIKEIKRGKSPKYADDSNVYVFAQKCNVKLGRIDISLAKFLDMKTFDKYPVEEYMTDGDIIINSTGNGTLGRIGIFRDSDRINDFVIVPDSHVTIIRAGNQIIKDYLFFALKYHQPYLEKLGEGSTNQTELRPSTVAELFIPVPPIGEQERIVVKLLEVLPMADVYGIKEKALQDYNKDFPIQLKKSILQEAVQGKLVLQDPADEPASVLLGRIRAEKEQLIKAGKIKRDKHESVIFRRDNSHYEKLDGIERCIDDEIPFEIPDSWEWVRFGQLYSLTNGTASRGSKDGTNRPVLRLADLSNNTIDISNVRNICLSEKEFLSHTIQKDDLVFIRVNGSKDRVASAFRYTHNEIISFCDHLFCGHKCSSLINADYIMFIFNCPSTRKQLIPEIKTTAGQNTISQTSMAKILLPVPPYSEQIRIVDEVSRIVTKIEHL